MWHERALLAQVNRDQWIVLTPDKDVYCESLGVLPLAEVRMLGAARQVPAELGRAPVHRFELPRRRGGIPTDREFDALQIRAVAMAMAEEGFAPEDDLDAAPAVADRLRLLMADGGLAAGSVIDGSRCRRRVELGSRVLVEMNDGRVLVCEKQGSRGAVDVDDVPPARRETGGAAAAAEDAPMNIRGSENAAMRDDVPTLRERLAAAGAIPRLPGPRPPDGDDARNERALRQLRKAISGLL